MKCPQGHNVPIGPDVDVARCSDCGAVVFSERGGATVAVVCDDQEMSETLGRSLQQNDLRVLHCNNGETFSAFLDAHSPQAVVIDVGLSSALAFHLVQEIRSAHRSGEQRVFVVLVASVYNKMAYKRRPSSLYGADDYVDQHHIQDMLPPKIIDGLRLAETPGAKSYAQRLDELAMLRWPDSEELRRVIASIARYSEDDLRRFLQGGDISASLRGAAEDGARALSLSPEEVVAKLLDLAKGVFSERRV